MIDARPILVNLTVAVVAMSVCVGSSFGREGVVPVDKIVYMTTPSATREYRDESSLEEAAVRARSLSHDKLFHDRCIEEIQRGRPLRPYG